MKSKLTPLALILSLAFVGACATTQPAPQASAPQAPAPPAASAPDRPSERGPSQMRQAVQWFRSSAEYRAITLSTYLLATRAVTAAAEGREKDTWAVVLDADETVLDNSVFQRDLVRDGGPFSEERWATFVRTHSSIPVPGAKAFLEKVRALGGRIAIVTNRWNNLCEDTRENFRLQSLPFDAVLCRETTGDKNPRFESAASGAAFGDQKRREVVAFLGDNIQDFPRMQQSLRSEEESAYADFGHRFFVLPNPMYGSWQQAPPR